ncbi:hypothetical protein ACR6C2_40130 [Streptomyces sp. INA 01156]
MTPLAHDLGDGASRSVGTSSGGRNSAQSWTPTSSTCTASRPRTRTTSWRPSSRSPAA